jgi:hypothetical protein
MATVTSQIGQGVVLMPAKFKTKHYTIKLPPELAARLKKPPTGQGGWQSLINEVRLHCTFTPGTPAGGGEVTIAAGGVLTLPDPLFRKLIPKATVYGSGGWQNMIRWVLCLVLEQCTEAVLGEAQTLKSMVKGAK